MQESHFKIDTLSFFLLISTAFIPQSLFEENLPLIIFFYLFVLSFNFIRISRGIKALDVIILIFIGIAALEVFFNSLDIAIAERRFFLTYAPLVILFLTAENQKEEAYALSIKSMVAICLVISIFMIYEFFIGENFIYSRMVRSVYIGKNFSYNNRAFGIFYHPTIAGAFLTMIFPFIALFLSDKGNKARLIFGHVAFIVISIAVFLTFSKMAWIILGGMYLWYLRHKGIYVERLILIVFSILALTFFVKINVFKHQFSPDFMVIAVGYRLKSLFIAMDMIKQHPIMGLGLDHFRLLYLNYCSEPNVPYHLRIPDNMYLTILTETGLIGFISFITFILVLIKKAINKLKNIESGSKKLLVETIFVSIASVLIHNLSYDSFYWSSPLIVFWMLAGALSNLTNLEA